MYFKFILLFITSVLSQKNPHFTPNRNTIVHLFEWKWLDIAHECENFLHLAGYGGVQVSFYYPRKTNKNQFNNLIKRYHRQMNMQTLLHIPGGSDTNQLAIK